MKISPSILSADFACLKDEILSVKDCDFVHVDVMDGHFVPNITVGIPVVKSLKKAVSIPLDVHLMITEPEKYIPEFCKAGSDIITFHIEATEDAEKCIELIKEGGAMPSVSIKPNTPAEAVFDILDKVGMVLVMTVEPGFGGQKFMADCLKKCEILAEEREKRGLDFMIQTDGGVNEETVIDCKNAKVDCAVAGSALFGAENRQEMLHKLQNV